MKRPFRRHVLIHGDHDADHQSVRYVAILIAMVAVLALALLGLPTGGSTLSGPAAGTTPTPTPAGEPAGQQSQRGFGSDIQAARNAAGVASQDDQSATSASP